MMNSTLAPCACCGSRNLPSRDLAAPEPAVSRRVRPRLPLPRSIARNGLLGAAVLSVPGEGGLLARPLTRRRFIRGTLTAATGLAGLGLAGRCYGDAPSAPVRNTFTFARIIYNGAWDAGLPKSDTNLSAELERLTGSRFATDIAQVSLGDQELFQHPFLYITGYSAANAFSFEEAEALRRHLSEGGFLFASDCGAGGTYFQSMVRTFMDEQVFRSDPKATYVQFDDEDHPIFNLAVPFSDWSPGLYRPGRYSGWEYDGRLCCFMASEYDNNCVLAGRAADPRITQQCLWQGANVLYYSMMV